MGSSLGTHPCGNPVTAEDPAPEHTRTHPPCRAARMAALEASIAGKPMTSAFRGMYQEELRGLKELAADDPRGSAP